MQTQKISPAGVVGSSLAISCLTLLLLSILQATQNRDGAALHAKLSKRQLCMSIHEKPPVGSPPQLRRWIAASPPEAVWRLKGANRPSR